MAEAVQGGLRTVDEAASPYLSGRFAPVRRESDADDLRVEGTQFNRVTIDPARGTATRTEVADQASEFPRVEIRAVVPNGPHANWFPRRVI
jgi:carotenoid cleavage dioxygenase-like enzyme